MSGTPTPWKVIAIDPAPAKGSTVVEDGALVRRGRSSTLDPIELRDYLMGVSPPVLVVWDSPLSPGSTESPLGADQFYSRAIERFFQRRAQTFHPPPGISIQGYAGCPHWALSQWILGYPSMRPDSQPREWRLLHARPQEEGRFVIETHPALAIWLWLRDKRHREQWRYKGQKPNEDATCRDRRQQLMEALSEHVFADSEWWPPALEATDDELDAHVAHALGRWFIDGDSRVDVLGGDETGSFLLPTDPVLDEAFEAFLGLSRSCGRVVADSGGLTDHRQGSMQGDAR